jgi:pimeloyl-ACP methyl ester carboxylesterase
VLLLHQTPRSSDEYRDVIPLLAEEFRVVAMDTIGYGDSYTPAHPCGIEDYARGAIALLDGLGIDRTAVVGHHTGAVIAIELAAVYPERVERLVLSASPFIDATERGRRRGRAVVDHVTEQADGSHVLELWRGRQVFYPPGRPDLLTRFLADALKAGDRLREGHEACSAYRMEETIGRIRCPTLVVCATGDRFSFPKLETVASHIPGSVARAIPGGVAVVDELPEAFVGAIHDFLRGTSGR